MFPCNIRPYREDLLQLDTLVPRALRRHRFAAAVIIF